MDLKDFFSAAEARIDRWCEMNTVAKMNSTSIFNGGLHGVFSTDFRRDSVTAGYSSIRGPKTIKTIFVSLLTTISRCSKGAG